MSLISPMNSVQSDRVTTDANGAYTWTYPLPFTTGVIPTVFGIAEGPNPTAGVLVNVQMVGTPTNTQAVFQVTKTNQTLVSLIGLTILSVPASVGATVIHIFVKAR